MLSKLVEAGMHVVELGINVDKTKEIRIGIDTQLGEEIKVGQQILEKKNYTKGERKIRGELCKIAKSKGVVVIVQ